MPTETNMTLLREALITQFDQGFAAAQTLHELGGTYPHTYEQHVQWSDALATILTSRVRMNHAGQLLQEKLGEALDLHIATEDAYHAQWNAPKKVAQEHGASEQ